MKIGMGKRPLSGPCCRSPVRGDYKMSCNSCLWHKPIELTGGPVSEWCKGIADTEKEHDCGAEENRKTNKENAHEENTVLLRRK